MSNWDYEPSWRGPITRTDAGEFSDLKNFKTAEPIDKGMWGTAGRYYGTTPDEVRSGWGMEGPSHTPKADYTLRGLRHEGKEEPTPFNTLLPWENRLYGWQGGGAVGLEPGIASMMGYAKGGMVTRVKVPKGQSKWMKRFMNNMRDN